MAGRRLNAPATPQQHTVHQTVADAMLERLGVNIRGQDDPHGQCRRSDGDCQPSRLRHTGTRIDVTVSRHGDSRAAGGTLSVTPLLAADGTCTPLRKDRCDRAFRPKARQPKSHRGVRLGRIANGALIEREIDFTLNRLVSFAWHCATPTLRPPSASSARSTTISDTQVRNRSISRPWSSRCREVDGNIVSFLTEIEQLQVEPICRRGIVIDERSGVVVIGRDVRVSTVAVGAGQPDSDRL